MTRRIARTPGLPTPRSPIPGFSTADFSTPGPGVLTVRQLLERQAAERGAAEAFLRLDRPAVSFADLAALVEDRRRYLLELGLGRGDRVALISNPHTAAAVAFLAIASLGTCAPLRPLLSRNELDACLSDLHATAIVIEKGLSTAARPIAEARGLPIIDLVAQDAGTTGRFAVAGRPWGKPRDDEEPGEDDVVLLLHTTGSTARAKLGPFTQSSLAHTAWGTASALGLGERDRCLTFMPLFHVHGLVSGVLVPLTAGGSVACVGAFDRAGFFRWLEVLRPTWYSTSPAIHQVILRQARQHDGSCHETSLRFVRSGSAALPPGLADEIEETFGVPMIEAYGMTEVPNISGNPVDAPRRGSVGRSAGPEIAILDQRGDPQPIGTVGEIAVRGPSVTPGYADDPVATAAAFRDGWLLTGDCGRLDADGYLYLEGRKKEQINRGGDKISPIEIDNALAALPEVEQAVTFAVPHPTLGEDLAAAAVLKTPGEISEARLLQSLSRRLAPYKLPTRILFVDEIPVADTGKPQRSQVARQLLSYLAEPAKLGAAPGSEALPSTAVERLVAEIWQAALGLDGIGLDDDCFALGATSLDVAEVARRLEARLGETVHIPLVMTQRTVRSLADSLVKLYRRALARTLKLSLPSEPRSSPIDDAMLERFRHLLKRRWRASETKSPTGPRVKNPRAVFVLSAPRSGSTLLRAMLAGHPGLFAPPELRLLHFESLTDWWHDHSGPHAFLRHGLLRAQIARSGLSPSQAEAVLEDRARDGIDVPTLLAEMQHHLSPRTLVDKTPLYAVDRTALERMETWFEEPLYIHLVRHPAAVVHSYTRAHMEQLWIGEQPFTSRQLAELLWIESQHRVLRHLRHVPCERWHRLDFESLVGDSEASMRSLCKFLGVAYDARLLQPYDDPASRMTDGVRPGSRTIGDPHFHSRQEIDAAAAEDWVHHFDGSTLSELTLQQAAPLGYGSGLEPSRREGHRRLAAMVRGWHGVRAHPDALVLGRNTEGSRRPLFWCLQSEEELSQLAVHLGAEQPVYGMRSAHNALVPTPRSLRGLAALYAREIRAVDPAGPYFVGGNCQGARIAFDVAHELLRGGASVGLLFVMESFIEAPYPSRVAMVYGAESRRFNPYLFHPSPESIWQRDYGAFSVDILPGPHGQFFRSPYVQTLAATLHRRLQEATAP